MSIHTCPDCNGEMAGITILDATDPGLRREASIYLPLRYAVEPPKEGLFSVKYRAAGQVTAKMCSDCGRIVLYGEAS
jgi:hypothetical protein